MAIDRVLKSLSKGDRIIPKGSIICDGDLPDANREILRNMGALAIISAPPLVEVPGWKVRANRVEPLGIETADQFIEADNTELRRVFRSSDERIDRWKQELIDWLTIPEKKG